MVAFCKLATLSKIKEMVVGTFFKTKHSLDLSYTSVDTRSVGGVSAMQYGHQISGWGLSYTSMDTRSVGQWVGPQLYQEVGWGLDGAGITW